MQTREQAGLQYLQPTDTQLSKLRSMIYLGIWIRDHQDHFGLTVGYSGHDTCKDKGREGREGSS